MMETLARGERKHRDTMVRALALLLALYGLSIAIIVPYFFQYAGAYASPSAINGLNIFEHGCMVDSTQMNLARGRLGGDLRVEESYPLPGLLTTSLLAITGSQFGHVAYIPIAGLGSLMYYALSRRVVYGMRPEHAWLASVYYWLILSCRSGLLTTGRACLGVATLGVFVFGYLRLLESPRSQVLPWLVVSLVATAMAGGTYYTATLAVIMVSLVSFVVSDNRFKCDLTRPGAIPLGFSIFVTAVTLFLAPPVLESVAPRISLASMAKNVWDAILLRVGAESSEARGFHGIYFEFGSIVQPIRQWTQRIVMLLSLVSMMLVIGSGVYNHELRTSRMWLYAIIAFGVCASELPYMFAAPLIPSRFLLEFGSLCFLCIVSRSARRKLLTFVTVGLFAVVVTSNFALSFAPNISVATAKPFSRRALQPIAGYLSHTVSNASVAADAVYASTLWLLLSETKMQYEVNVLPLGRDAILLEQAQEGYETTLVEALNRRRVDYLLLNLDGMPFYGDAWGYGVRLRAGKWLTALPLDLVFNNGGFVLTTVFNPRAAKP